MFNYDALVKARKLLSAVDITYPLFVKFECPCCGGWHTVNTTTGENDTCEAFMNVEFS